MYLTRYLRNRYDICVLGGGPAGIASAIRAYDYGKQVCLIEKNCIGGVNLWNGALQSKTLWEMSRFVSSLKSDSSKVFIDPNSTMPPLDYNSIHAELDNVATTREKQFVYQLESVNIPVLSGSASFVDPHTVKIQFNDGHEEVIQSDYFVVACGAKPRIHSLISADDSVVFTSDSIMRQPFPKSIVIIGAGVIGCEFATIFANFGYTKVYVIEKSSRILPMEDEDISCCISKLLEAKNVTFHYGAQLVEGFVQEDNQFLYRLKNIKTGEITTHVVEKALISIGRVPNVEGLNLECLSVQMQNGKPPRTKFNQLIGHPHIYLCGDIATRIALVNVAELEARACVEHMFKPYPEDELLLRLDNLSTIMFLDEEVSAVGLGEQQCRIRGIGYKAAIIDLRYVTRAITMSNTVGFVKLITTNDDKMQVLGIRAVGPHASSLIELASLAIHNRDSVYTLNNLLCAYPSMTEGFQECVNLLIGCSLYEPGYFPGIEVREWTPDFYLRGRAYQK